MHKHATANRSFRLVWSAARGAYVVAPETASGRSKSSACAGVSGSGQAARLAGALVFAAGIAWCGGGFNASAQVLPAPTSVLPTGSNTRAYTNPNGVPVVNIATANAAGLSNNQYTQYNVDANGLVLNNIANASGGRSQLAGQVQGNLNLNAPARVILNQVVAPNRSMLAGFTEVLGNKADVIVANPYGITCGGCGFLNTDRVTLTTGLPTVGADGSLAGFSVTGGDILVNGTGLNATAQQVLDLVTRSVRLDGQVNAAPTGAIGITTGNNQWSYGSRTVTGSTAGSGAAPSFAIDSTALGGMYAGRIQLIATEAGVGVRMLGEVAASTDDFTLNSAGRIDLRNKIATQRDLTVTTASAGADAINLANAQLSATRDLQLQATGGATVSGGVLVAGGNLGLSLATLSDIQGGAAITDNNKRFGDTVNITTTGAAVLDGVSWGAAKALNASAGSLDVGTSGATLSAGTTLALTTAADMNLGKATVWSSGDMSLAAATGAIRTTAGGQGVESKNGTLDISAGNGLDNQGAIAASNGAMSLKVNGTLDNAGTLYSKSNMAISDKAGAATENISNSGTLLADGTLGIQAAQVANSGNLQGTGGTTLTAASLDNSGKFIAASAAGASATLNLATLNNSGAGTIQASQDLALNVSSALTNAGNVIAGRNLAISSTGGALALTNQSGGTLQAGAASGSTLSVAGPAVTLNNNAGAKMLGDTFTVAAATVNNDGTLQGGTGASTLAVTGALTNSGTLTLATSAAGSGNVSANLINNSGTLQSTGAATLSTATALNNTVTGKILANQLAVTAATLANAGVLQGGAGASTLNVTNTLANASTGTLTLATDAAGSGTITANALTNEGTLQSSGAAMLNVATLIDNKTGAKVMADRLAVASASLNNAGVLQGGTGASTLNVTNTLANSGTLTLATTAAGSGAITADTVTNSGTLQSTGSAALNVATALNNTAAGKIMAGTSLTVRGTDTAYAVDNQGLMQSGGALDVKGQAAGNGVTIAIGGSGKMLGQTVALNTQSLAIANGGNLSSTGDMTVVANTLTLGGTTAKIVGSTAGGNTTITTTSAFSNPGAVHSGGDLVFNAASIDNTATGGMSALGNLNATATNGDISNAGALYAGNTLTASAAGRTITNVGTLSGQVGTMDSGGAMNLSAGTFINNSTVRAGGAVTISAATFRNEVQGGDTREWTFGTRSGGDTPYNTTKVFNGLGDLYTDYYKETWRNTQRYTGGTPTFTPQIIGGTSVTVQNFSGGTNGNRGAVISAPTVNINGTGSFVNDGLALSYQDYQHTWANETQCAGFTCGSQNYFTNRLLAGSDSGDQQTANVVFSTRNAGIYAGNLNASGFGLSTVSSAYGAAPVATNAAGATGGTSVAASTPASPTGTVVNATPVGTATSISFGGIVIQLPTNPNGYFVVRPGGSADYLVETNPLFATVTNLYGSAYLAEQYQLKPELLTKRLGDDNYEAYLIRQQLLAQTGKTLLAGYQYESDLLQAMMKNGAVEAKNLGFAWGEAPTADMLAKLTHDVVWMVKVNVAGQDVLTPVVYLSPNTIAGIRTGSVLEAGNITMTNMASVTNEGGAIIATDSLSITASGDIKNQGGSIKGGTVALTSTAGGILNETLTRTDCADGAAFCSTVIGNTAGIESTKGALALDAAKDIKVIGADLKAKTDASLVAGGNITFDTIVDKSRASEHGTSAAGSGIGLTEWASTTTTEKNIGSTLQTGGDLTLRSKAGDIGFYNAAVGVGGKLDATSDTGSLTIGARQDKVTTHEESRSTAMFSKGSLLSTENTVTDTVKGTNAGSAFTVKGDTVLHAAKDITVQGSSLDIGGNAGITSTGGSVRVLDGLNEESVKSTTTTTSFLVLGDPNASEGPTNRAYSQRNYTTARDQGTGGVAIAYADNRDIARGSVELMKSQTTTVNDVNRQSVGSLIKVGGNLDITAANPATPLLMEKNAEGKDVPVFSQPGIGIRGSDIRAGGNVTLQAKNIEVLAGENSHVTTTSTKSTSVGLYMDGRSISSAEAGGQGALLSGRADASFKTENDGALTIGARNATKDTTATKVTNTGSTITSGGALTVKADETAKFVGSQLNAGGDLSITAKDITNLAAVNREETTTRWTENTEGLYIDGRTESQGYARVRASVSGTPGVGAKALIDNKSDVSVGYRNNQRSGSADSGTTNAVVNQFTAGGNVTRTAAEKITDQGTRITATTGNITQTAKILDDQAVHDKAWDNKQESNKDFRVGVYVGSWAEEIVGVQAGVGGNSKNTGNNPSLDLTAGIRSYNVGGDTETKSSFEQAVTSRYTAGGGISSTTTGKTTLVGTQMAAANGGITITAGELDYQAAQNKSERTSSRLDWSADGRVGVGAELVKGELVPTAVVEGVGKVDTMTINRTNTTAVAGSLEAKGGGVSVTTTGAGKSGDLRLEGTKIEARDAVTVASGNGNLVLDAAEDTQSRTGLGFNVTLKLRSKATDPTGDGSSQGGSAGFELTTGHSSQDYEKVTNHGVDIKSSAGNVALSAGKSLTAEGVKVSAAGTVDLTAKTGISLLEATDTETLNANAHSSFSTGGFSAITKLMAESKELNKMANAALAAGKLERAYLAEDIANGFKNLAKISGPEYDPKQWARVPGNYASDLTVLIETQTSKQGQASSITAGAGPVSLKTDTGKITSQGTKFEGPNGAVTPVHNKPMTSKAVTNQDSHGVVSLDVSVAGGGGTRTAVAARVVDQGQYEIGKRMEVDEITTVKTIQPEKPISAISAPASLPVAASTPSPSGPPAPENPGNGGGAGIFPSTGPGTGTTQPGSGPAMEFTAAAEMAVPAPLATTISAATVSAVQPAASVQAPAGGAAPAVSVPVVAPVLRAPVAVAPPAAPGPGHGGGHGHGGNGPGHGNGPGNGSGNGPGNGHGNGPGSKPAAKPHNAGPNTAAASAPRPRKGNRQVRAEQKAKAPLLVSSTP